MKLLHVIGSMDPASGGPAQGIRNLDKVMRHFHVEREVICLDPQNASYLGGDDFKIYPIGAGKGPWRYNPELKKWLTCHLNKYDILIINGLWSYPSYATWRAIKWLKKKFPERKLPKVFVMPHGMLDPYFQLAADRKWKALRNRIYWKWIESRVVNDADGLLFTCQTELLLARTTFKSYKPKNEYNVGYGVNEAPSFKEEMTVSFNKVCPAIENQPYWLFLSRIHPKKGVENLLNAYIELNVELGSDALLPILIIAGPGMETAYGHLLRQQLKEHPSLERKILFPGMLTGDAKWGAFYGCEAFVLPSHQENFGIAVVEALSCKKPVLISDQVNIWREIAEGQGGIIAHDDLIGAKQLLHTWWNLSEQQRSNMQEDAFRTFQTHFFLPNVVKNYLEAFENVQAPPV